MTRRDWLVGSDRSATAVDRILSAAADSMARRGFQGFTIDQLAAEVHCSPATIYRHTGGKTAIIEAVMHRYSATIVSAVLERIDGLEGAERAATAVVAALELIRADPLGRMMMETARPERDSAWLTDSPLVAELAEKMLGRRDPVAAQWLVRSTLALWHWPIKDRAVELEVVRRFVGPPFRDGT